MKKALSILVLISMVLGLSAFACASTELTSAKLYIQQKNNDKALEALEKEVAKNPKSDEGFYLLGYVNGEDGNLDGMVENFDKSLAISNKFEKNIVDYRQFQWQDNFNKGVGLFNRGTKVEAKDSSKRFFDMSVERFQNCILIAPDSVGAYQNMVYSMMNADRNTELEVPLLKIIELNNSVDAYVDLSKVYNNEAIVLMNSYYDSKNIDDSLKAMAIYDKEIALLEKGQEIHKDNPIILAQLSNAYVDANRLDVAMATFQKGIESDPTNEVYRYNYGVLLLGANDYEGASEQFNKAIEIKEDYTSAYYNLGVCYLKWGADLQEVAIEANSEDLTYKEKYGLAVAPLERYLEENSEDADIWNYLGKVYANLGDTAKSQEAFDKADLYR